MNRRRPHRPDLARLTASLLFVLAVLTVSPLEAQIEIRLSVKFVIDQSNNPPGSTGTCTTASCEDCSAVSCIDELQAKIDWANRVLDRHGRGYRFEVIHAEPLLPPLPPDEIPEDADVPKGVDKCLDDLDDWATDGCSLCARHVLEYAARNDPLGYDFDENAINIYILDCPDESGCGAGGSATRHPYDPAPVMFIAQRCQGAMVRPLHELGHTLGLCHTHGCPEEFCGNKEGDGNDCIDDTLRDDPDWEGADQITQGTYGSETSFVDLEPDEQNRVLDVLYNIMSYHRDNDSGWWKRFRNTSTELCGNISGVNCDAKCTEDPPYEICRHRLTPDQLDRIADRVNAFYEQQGAGIASGLTHFVDAVEGDDLFGVGSSTKPYATLPRAVDAASQNPAGDNIVLLREGDYAETTIEIPLTLRATRGEAIIGR